MLLGCRGVNLKIIANGNRDIMAWQGASVIASMDSFMTVRHHANITQTSRANLTQTSRKHHALISRKHHANITRKSHAKL